LITRPHVDIADLLDISPEGKKDSILYGELHPDVISQAEIQMKYEGYIEREEELAKKMGRMDDVAIPLTLDYSGMVSVSFEAREKLNKVKPVTVGQASRISGVSPSDIAVILIHLGK